MTVSISTSVKYITTGLAVALMSAPVVFAQADTYGSTRSNRGSGNGITAPQPDVTPDVGDVQSRAIVPGDYWETSGRDVGDVQSRAISYGSTRSNTRESVRDFEMPDVDDVQDRANINTSRSNRKTSSITAPQPDGTTEALKLDPIKGE